jgi:acyl-coenzyme A synthetase/AMP-(fatty) acid ligase
MASSRDKKTYREIKDILNTFPGILDISVVGVADDICGEAIKALIVMREGIAIAKADIIRFCDERRANNTKPILIEFYKKLPKNLPGSSLKTF